MPNIYDNWTLTEIEQCLRYGKPGTEKRALLIEARNRQQFDNTQWHDVPLLAFAIWGTFMILLLQVA